ncbi:hypothetical protein FH609_002565 [Streptomyces sp. 3MP-14]|uniref:Uncharacterized protein n=1 Tax=Streptomyces mimosae TaxID=2586635 RepID=A0A5N6ADZ4_9ACTN|nr:MULTISPECIES: hypothetical protein [Streptomyces]KAB8166445.1 hypothetical protein FH607_011515 [Streptomyces mimosae]KAB8178874.1 hypothetical protein FH609_002565 [Streptomyces sp. 3MP-14]
MRIDLDKAVETAEELLAELKKLNGAEPDDAPTRVARHQRSEITRQLLYLGHLGERVSVEIMGAYHEYKGQEIRRGGGPAAD